MPIYKKVTKSGDITEIEYYLADPVKSEAGRLKVEPKLRHPSTENQKKKNKRRRDMHRIRLINKNFNWKNANYITLTFEGKEPTFEEAEKELDRFIKRTRRKYPAQKWVYVLGQRNKERIHIHLIIANADASFVCSKWTCGKVKKVIRLYKHNYTDNGADHHADYTGLALYFLKHCKDDGHSHWHQSRNLEMPDIEPAKERLYDKPTPPKPELGYILIEQNTNNEDYAGIYRYYKYVKVLDT